ncbi:MAG: PD-(D/E)XK motif protein [Thaumarchaeota archaeon]|nr:PD-(D/E)XK motif protein [Nitrososphaerota archaeon]
MSISAVWDDLLQESERERGKHGLLVRRLVPESQQDLFLALPPGGNGIVLLLRIPYEVMPSVADLPQGRGFSLRVTGELFADPSHVTVALQLTDLKQAELFCTLLDDVVARVAEQTEPAGMVRALLARLRAWQRFMAEHAEDILGIEARHGLYGELWVLREVLLPRIGTAAAVQCWTGPDAGHQDFQLTSCSIEVKASTAKQPQAIRVSSERQLDETVVSRFWFYHLSLNASKADGESLPEIVADIRRRFTNDESTRGLFDDKLLMAGYLEKDADRYSEPRYSLRRTGIYRVEGMFPRIREADLLHGVSGVTYLIDLGYCEPFAVTEEEFITTIG